MASDSQAIDRCAIPTTSSDRALDADFASFDPRLVVEFDDPSHEFRDESTRTRYFESKGFAMLRFTNRQIAQELPEAVGTIEAWVEHIRCQGVAPE